MDKRRGRRPSWFSVGFVIEPVCCTSGAARRPVRSETVPQAVDLGELVFWGPACAEFDLLAFCWLFHIWLKVILC